MTRIPQPAPDTYAAAVERAEAAEQLAAERLDALAAVREAIGIPSAATVGGEEVRTPILLERVRHLEVFLDSVLRDKPAELAWSVAYLRERLAEHPASGYRTWDEARADLDAQASKPAWLYGSGCCEHWTPEHGCSAGHTGRPAMSLRAREDGAQ